MPVTNYHTVNGEIIAETTSGVRTDYLTDALGSVTATMNQSAQIINTYRYKPFGALLAKTGTGADPAFGWVGSQGYRQTNKKFSDFYVRARHYDMETARWSTLDRLGAQELITNQYLYAYANPTRWLDPSGLKPNCQTADCCASKKPGTDLTCMGEWKDCPPENTYRDLCDKLRTTNHEKYCRQIASALLSALKNCNFFCEQGKYGIGSGVDAITLCCCQNGITKFCRTQCCESFVNSAPENPCSAYCLLRHEDTHRVLDCGTRKPCTNDDDIGDKGSECCAYRNQSECLFKMFDKNCGNYRINRDQLRVYYNQCKSSAGRDGFTKCTKDWTRV